MHTTNKPASGTSRQFQAPLGGGGCRVNSIEKGTKTGKHRIHISNANGAPLCGGGNSARNAQWQETMLQPNCKRCASIQYRRLQAATISSTKP